MTEAQRAPGGASQLARPRRAGAGQPPRVRRGHALHQRRGAPRTRRGPHHQGSHKRSAGRTRSPPPTAAWAAGSIRRSPGRSWTPSSRAPKLATSQLWGWSRHGPFGIKGPGNRSGTEPSTRRAESRRVRRPDPGNGQRMTEPPPYIDVANLPAPAEGIVVTMFITVRGAVPGLLLARPGRHRGP